MLAPGSPEAMWLPHARLPLPPKLASSSSPIHSCRSQRGSHPQPELRIPNPPPRVSFPGEPLCRTGSPSQGAAKLLGEQMKRARSIQVIILGRKAMTHLDNALKSRDVPLPTKDHRVKAMVFPVVTDRCENWTVKKAEHQRMDAFERWC